MTRILDIAIDPQTLARAAVGDTGARQAVYESYAPAVMGLIRRMVRSRPVAEDLFQDTLIAIFEHLHEFRGEAPFGAWVRRVAVSRCLMHLRSPWQRSRELLEDSAEPAVDGAANVPDLIDLERALAQLPDVTRSVLWLCEVEGYTHDEIARGFGRSVSFSKSQLARAHRRLAMLLATPEGAAPAGAINGPVT